MRCAILAFSGLLMTGCATITLDSPTVVSEEVVSRHVDHPRRDGVMTAAVEQDGTEITVQAKRTCLSDEVEYKTVARVTARERRNPKAASEWATYGLLGGLSIASGIVTLASSQLLANQANSPPAGQNSSPGEEIALGVGLLVVGAALFGIPTVDAFRAMGAEEETSQRQEQAVLRSNLSCGTRPFIGAHASGETVSTTRIGLYTGPTQFTLGLTSDKGSLSVDLTDLIPRDALLGLTDDHPKLSVTVESSAIGEIDLAPILHHYENEEWKVASAAQCASQPSLATCRAVSDFLHHFPRGRHVEEAKGAIRQYVVAVENEAWQAVRVTRCTSMPSESTCDPV